MKNIKILYTIIIALLLFIGISFSAAKDHVALSKDLLNRFHTESVAAALLINKNGDITLVDKNGKPGTPCTFAGQKGKVCKGFEGGAVLDLKSVSVIKTRGSICFSYVTSAGSLRQICY